MYRNRLLFLLVLVCLLAALTPLSDFDQDGSLDSLVTEGFVLIPVLCSVTGLFSLLIKLPATCLTIARPISTQLVPPPITTK